MAWVYDAGKRRDFVEGFGREAKNDTKNEKND